MDVNGPSAVVVLKCAQPNICRTLPQVEGADYDERKLTGVVKGSHMVVLR
jgi:hypothetical protein